MIWTLFCIMTLVCIGSVTFMFITSFLLMMFMKDWSIENGFIYMAVIEAFHVIIGVSAVLCFLLAIIHNILKLF
jgi:hypothetical protein